MGTACTYTVSPIHIVKNKNKKELERLNLIPQTFNIFFKIDLFTRTGVLSARMTVHYVQGLVVPAEVR